MIGNRAYEKGEGIGWRGTCNGKVLPVTEIKVMEELYRSSKVIQVFYTHTHANAVDRDC